jgi:hypothetical protein
MGMKHQDAKFRMMEWNPMKIGARVDVRAGAADLRGRIVDLAQSDWIAVQTDDGRMWLEVSMNISALGFTRLVLLEGGVSSLDRADFERIAAAVAFRPRRTNVDDVPGAARLCPPDEGIIAKE